MTSSLPIVELNGKTVYVTPTGGVTHPGSACCPYVNVTFGSSKASLLLQNPFGNQLETIKSTLDVIFQKTVKKLDKTDVDKIDLEKAVGKTLQAV